MAVVIDPLEHKHYRVDTVRPEAHPVLERRRNVVGFE
jgi:hypothetical protein